MFQTRKKAVCSCTLLFLAVYTYHLKYVERYCNSIAHYKQIIYQVVHVIFNLHLIWMTYRHFWTIKSIFVDKWLKYLSGYHINNEVYIIIVTPNALCISAAPMNLDYHWGSIHLKESRSSHWWHGAILPFWILWNITRIRQNFTLPLPKYNNM